MSLGAGRRAWLAGATLLLVAGCAQPPKAAAVAGEAVWHGRLALTVEGRPEQSVSAAFQLRGASGAGELTLSNPLGGILAVLAWSPGSATLRTASDLRRFDSLDALAAQATGAPLPVAALFDWLAGRNTAAAGWQADLAQLAEGRLRAQRNDPLPVADLRLVLDR